MSLTGCALRSPGHDSSVGECMYLSVRPLRGPGSIPGQVGLFRGGFPSLVTLNGTIQPVDITEEGLRLTTD